MYEAYWNLKSQPFSRNPGESFFFPGRSAESTLQRMTWALENLSGPVLIPGPSGAGKTTLVRRFATEFSEYSPFVQMLFPVLSADEMLRMILRELSGQESLPELGRDGTLVSIRSALRQLSEAGTTLLFFDDAHLLSDEIIVQVLHPLLCLEEADSAIQLKIILAGQPHLAERIQRFSAVSERVAVCSPLELLSLSETADFVTLSLAAVGCETPIFSTDSLTRLHRLTDGNPRRIARLCEMALLVGFAEEQQQIDVAVIDAVAGEVLRAAA